MVVPIVGVAAGLRLEIIQDVLDPLYDGIRPMISTATESHNGKHRSMVWQMSDKIVFSA